MAYLGNSPGQATILRVEARKSFALGLHLRDPKNRPVDLTGCTLTIVAREVPITAESENFLAEDALAVVPDPTTGYARFEIQAASLDQKPGEYPYAIVLQTAEGYSSVIVKGVLDIQQNTEFDSVHYAYEGVNAPQSLTVLLREANSINVYVGGQLPPGMNYVRDSVMEVLENFDPDSIAVVPPGGAGGYVLTKTSNGDYAMDWRPQGNGAFALDATGQPPGAVPTAQGDDTWDWSDVGIDATGVPAGWAPVARGDDTWEWDQVTFEPPVPDWEAGEEEEGYIRNKPALGTAAALDAEDVLPAGLLLSEMEGVHFQTTVPTTGEDGHLYFVYEE